MVDYERALVRRAVRRDADAFAELYDLYIDRIFKYVYYKVGLVPVAEDLTSQVFLKAWERIGDYQPTERPFAAWLYRIAHNLIVDHYRTRRAEAPLDELPLADERMPSFDDWAELHLTRERLQRAIARLTDDQQQVIILKFLEGYGTEQVGEILGKDKGAVRALQFRALNALQRLLRQPEQDRH
ncbi:MAG: sigma-70 family RNA polymerase sigma factor [Chloroflexi bacterium]|nr:sigma-70 family RNA polymerase sigma factor [Chloroflexota bacterium]